MLHSALCGHPRRELSGTFQNPPDGPMFAGEGRTGSGCPASVDSSEPVFPEDPRQGCASPHPLQVLGGGLSEQTSPVDRALCTHLNADPAPLDGQAPA